MEEYKPLLDEKASGLIRAASDHVWNAFKVALAMIVFGAAIMFFYEHSRFSKDTISKTVESPKSFELFEREQRMKFREDIAEGVKQAMKEN